MDYSSLFVCLMGMGTVFFGLICLIVLTTLMSAICGRGHSPAAPVPAVPAAPPGSGRGPSGPGGGHRCRCGGGSGDRYHRHPNPVTEKTVIRFWEKEFGS